MIRIMTTKKSHRLQDDTIRYPICFAFHKLIDSTAPLCCSRSLCPPADQGFLTPFTSMAEEVDKSRNCEAED